MNTSQAVAPTRALAFCLALSRAHAALSRRFDGRLGSFHGISFADFAILLELHHAPGNRLRRVDLADRLSLTASAVTRALIPLEKIGMVMRKPDPNDARVGFAILTAAGRRVLEESLVSAEEVAAEQLPAGARVAEAAELLARLG